jgi:hypothetical protein
MRVVVLLKDIFFMSFRGEREARRAFVILVCRSSCGIKWSGAIAGGRPMSFAGPSSPCFSADPHPQKKGATTRTVARAQRARIVRKEGKAPIQEEQCR